jgi:hypothetical protein
MPMPMPRPEPLKGSVDDQGKAQLLDDEDVERLIAQQEEDEELDDEDTPA